MDDLIQLGGGWYAERRENGDFAIRHIGSNGLHMADCEEQAMVVEIERLRAQVAELERDAGRYAWLKEHHSWWLLSRFPAQECYEDARTVFDAAIDAAIAAQEQKCAPTQST